MTTEREALFSDPERQAKLKRRREAAERALAIARNRGPTTDAIFDAMRRKKPLFNLDRTKSTGAF